MTLCWLSLLEDESSPSRCTHTRGSSHWIIYLQCTDNHIDSCCYIKKNEGVNEWDLFLCSGSKYSTWTRPQPCWIQSRAGHLKAVMPTSVNSAGTLYWHNPKTHTVMKKLHQQKKCITAANISRLFLCSGCHYKTCGHASLHAIKL